MIEQSKQPATPTITTHSVMKLPASLFALLVLFAAIPAKAQQAGVLKPGDSVQISLQTPSEDASTVTTIYPVSDRGTVKLPMLDQEIPCAGISAAALARRIEAAYKAADIYTNPTITAALPQDPQLASHVVSVGGEVRATGEFPLRAGMTLMAAINRAGGFTEFAKTKAVKLLRGNNEKIYDMRRINADGSNNPVLMDGDQIIVPAG